MKKLPQIHFWRETVCAHDPELKTSVIAMHCCRSWDVPANGVFMLFLATELYKWDDRQACIRKLVAKLEARERALVNYYGREAKRHLDQIDLTPAERKARTEARAREAEHEF